MLITAAELATIMPRAGDRVAVYLDPLIDGMREFAIDNPDRVAAFLAQVAVESAELRKVEEDLNYTTARLLVVWPTRFQAPADALPYAHNPMGLANHVYANRNGNGDEASGDGWRYRGAGLIQITFRDNQAACALYFGVALNKIGGWLREPEGAARSACWYWRSRGLSQLADTQQFGLITRRVTGDPKLRSLPERSAYWERAKGVLA